MSDELQLRLLVVDDEPSIRRLCMTVGQRFFQFDSSDRSSFW